MAAMVHHRRSGEGASDRHEGLLRQVSELGEPREGGLLERSLELRQRRRLASTML